MITYSPKKNRTTERIVGVGAVGGRKNGWVGEEVDKI